MIHHANIPAPGIISPAAAAPGRDHKPIVTNPADSLPAELSLDTASVPDVVRALSLATGHARYVLAPGVVGSTKKLTLAVTGTAGDVWRDGLAALDLAGVEARCVSGLCKFSEKP